MPSRRRAPRTPEQRQQQWTRSLIPGSLGGGVANASPILPGVTDGRALARGAGGAFGAGGSVLAYQDVFTLAAAGAQAVSLTYLPITNSEHVYLNGLYQRETDDWIRSDRTINVQAGMDARAGDVLAVEYLYASAVPVAPTSNYSAEILADAPWIYWRLGDASGTTVTDSSGNARHGTYTNSPTLGASGLIAGDPDTAVTFGAGVNDHVVYNPDNTIQTALNSQRITVEAVIKTSASGAYQLVADRDGDSRVFQLRLTPAGLVEFLFIVGGAAAGTVTSPSAVNDGTARHLAVVRDATHVRLYINGTQVASTAWAGTIPEGTAGGDVWHVGISGQPPYVYPFVGTVDEVVYYGTALGSDRVLAHAQAGGFA